MNEISNGVDYNYDYDGVCISSFLSELLLSLLKCQITMQFKRIKLLPHKAYSKIYTGVYIALS